MYYKHKRHIHTETYLYTFQDSLDWHEGKVTGKKIVSGERLSEPSAAQHTQAGSCSASLQPVWFEQSSDSCLLILSSQFCHVMVYLSTHFSQAKRIQVAQEFFLVWFGFKSYFLQPLYDCCHYRDFWTVNNCSCYSVFLRALRERWRRIRSLVYWNLFLSFHLILLKDSISQMYLIPHFCTKH